MPKDALLSGDAAEVCSKHPRLDSEVSQDMALHPRTWRYILGHVGHGATSWGMQQRPPYTPTLLP